MLGYDIGNGNSVSGVVIAHQKDGQMCPNLLLLFVYCYTEPVPEVPKGTAPQFLVPIQPSKVFESVF